jgi:hypothetical protein
VRAGVRRRRVINHPCTAPLHPPHPSLLPPHERGYGLVWRRWRGVEQADPSSLAPVLVFMIMSLPRFVVASSLAPLPSAYGPPRWRVNAFGYLTIRNKVSSSWPCGRWRQHDLVYLRHNATPAFTDAHGHGAVATFSRCAGAAVTRPVQPPPAAAHPPASCTPLPTAVHVGQPAGTRTWAGRGGVSPRENSPKPTRTTHAAGGVGRERGGGGAGWGVNPKK